MVRQVTQYDIQELSHKESPGEILLETNLNTEFLIKGNESETVISFPFGNKFDIVNGKIIVKPI